MNFFQCVACSRYYADQSVLYQRIKFEKVPDILVCQDAQCPGEGLTGLCIPVEKSADDIVREINGVTNGQVHAQRDLGLCVFLMDASGSMGENAFGDASRPSILGGMAHPNNSPAENKGQMSKREMVALAAAQGIFGLRNIVNKGNAYICVILYDDQQKYLFFKSVETIIKEYGDPPKLASELFQEMKNLNGGTDIKSALDMAYILVDKFKNGAIDALGPFNPVTQDIPYIHDANTGKKISPSRTLSSIPNMRILLYSDGEQLPEYGVLESPFENTSPPDPLIGVYIGRPNTDGERELRSIVRKCPIHGEDQFLLVDRPEALPSLHGIFRMASGQSGFCVECLKSLTQRRTDH